MSATPFWPRFVVGFPNLLAEVVLGATSSPSRFVGLLGSSRPFSRRDRIWYRAGGALAWHRVDDARRRDRELNVRVVHTSDRDELVHRAMRSRAIAYRQAHADERLDG